MSGWLLFLLAWGLTEFWDYSRGRLARRRAAAAEGEASAAEVSASLNDVLFDLAMLQRRLEEPAVLGRDWE